MARALNEDEILRALARTARRESEREARHGDRWDSLAEDVLSDHGAEAFGAEFQAGVVRRLSTEIGVAQGRRQRRRWRRAGLALAASLVLASGALHWLAPRPDGTDRGEVALLPEYSISRAVGLRSERSPNARQPVDVVPGYRFEIHLRPGEPVAGPVGVRALAGAADGRLVAWAAAEGRVERLDNGVLILDDLGADDWRGLTPGAWTLYFAVARPTALPSRDQLRAAIEKGGAAGTAGWQLLRQEIRLAEAP